MCVFWRCVGEAVQMSSSALVINSLFKQQHIFIQISLGCEEYCICSAYLKFKKKKKEKKSSGSKLAVSSATFSLCLSLILIC